MVLGKIAIGVKYLLRRPYTRMYPYKEKAYLTERTRARHILKMDICIGCRACQLACPADAIMMYTVKGEWSRNRQKIFPGIDYSKCTYCALCVEACPTGALIMTDYTMEHLVTLDKRTTRYTPVMLAEEPDGEYIVTVSKPKLDQGDLGPRPPSPPKKKEGEG